MISYESNNIKIFLFSLFILISSLLYVNAIKVPESIDPRYDSDWYAKYSYFHYAAYYMYGEVKGWYVPFSSGYYSSDHYGYASMGIGDGHLNKVVWIKVCGRGFDQYGNLILVACTNRIYSKNGGVSVEASITLDYLPLKAYKSQTKVAAFYIHYDNGYYYAYFTSYIPYPYVEVNY